MSPHGHLVYVCPRCKGTLSTEHSRDALDLDYAYVCAACGVRYPVVLGIPDFRVAPDPWISLEADREKGRLLADRAGGLDFAGVVDLYWRLTLDTPPELARLHALHALSGVERGCATLAEVVRLAGEAPVDVPLLEIGCGTGGLLIAASEHFDRVVGVDIAFRWLVVARARLTEAGCGNVQLVCCCAEALPFPDAAFGLVVGANVIEHSAQQESLVREALRAVHPGGVAFFTNPNRFALAPEPHVHVWGVGLLPRRLMPAWVGLVRGVPYRHHRLLSVFELRRVLRRAGAERYRIVLPRIGPSELTGRGRWVRRGAALYGRLLGVPVARWALYLWGPAFHALAWGRPDQEKRNT